MERRWRVYIDLHIDVGDVVDDRYIQALQTCRRCGREHIYATHIYRPTYRCGRDVVDDTYIQHTYIEAYIDRCRGCWRCRHETMIA